MSAFDTKRTCPFALHMSANDPKRTLRSARRARCTASAFGGSLSESGKCVMRPSLLYKKKRIRKKRKPGRFAGQED
jgi:hypothetical protein